MDKRAIVLHPLDNVATAIADLETGDAVQISDRADCVAIESVPFGHKIALVTISPGAPIIKYGEKIGLAAANIQQGACVHIHNIEGQRGRGDKAAGEE